MSSSSPPTVRGSGRACTEVKTENFSYEWVIKNFEFLPQKNGEYIHSPIFRTNNNEVEWKLSVYPRGDKVDSTDYVSIFLWLHSYKDKTIKIEVHFEFCILPNEITHSGVHTYETIIGHGFSKMIERSELLKSCRSNNTVTIRCKIDIPGETITKPIEIAECMDEEFNCQTGQLSQDFRLLFKESKCTDVTVIVGTKKFPAHKAVLAARSPVFSAMFENKETEENLKNEVKIEKIEASVVEAMLEFFYTDEVTNLEELACGLLEAADKYNIQRLRSMCEKVLYKTLGKENATEILTHADLHHSHKLKEYVMEFIDDHLLDVIESEGYKEMKENYPALLDELIHSVAVRKKSKE